MHQRLGQLEEQNQQINPQIQEQLAEIKEAIAPIITLTQKITYLEQISQKINARMIESAQNFNNQIDSVNQRLENLEINEQEINPQIQQQFAEIKYAISHIDNIYDFFAKLKKQETENQSPPSVQTQYRKERIFQQEEKTNIGEDNQTKSNQKTSETEKPQTPKSPVPNIVKNEIEQTIETAKNDIQQGKREIEEEVKKLGESLNNLFKP
ncbi:MAG TPA: hypothetical protein DEG17_19535 [Cyanobacteria bacterium UBA11149]|nr:hypothetical protein [Cyanobacteria bacterium UBA11367]HBE56244.1 hypothetical protein [Cyanobacteria bacterium UBA11366]HBK64643.1 hypothetical protein [Cyanobacteria bacterium UBA11166]HBR76207.1 hypothetical protein [Cyanobacteria bacterium UBA11159]HBS68131.1 hypothetical protein [Cyanobacteria bacterium UBA11153]HBW90993.1 hypothetical protein [Cyanobacteria bacterium UBA11149]HCA95281.1 hypothetical protein [Cyanobacteria bacterium UBA9226]